VGTVGELFLTVTSSRVAAATAEVRIVVANDSTAKVTAMEMVIPA
jgi:hypothetical protein